MPAHDSLPFVDELLPEYHVQSQHSIVIGASRDVVYPVVRTLDLSGSRLVRTLFTLRGLPVSALSADGLARLRFKVLREELGRGLAMGLIGRFWTPSGELLDFDPDRFGEPGPSGFAKAVWAFDLSSRGVDETVVRTVTRVQCQDATSTRRFLWYWRLVGPFSGLIRRAALEAVKKKAEKGE